jgi:hypothetical protein
MRQWGAESLVSTRGEGEYREGGHLPVEKDDVGRQRVPVGLGPSAPVAADDGRVFGQGRSRLIDPMAQKV